MKRSRYPAIATLVASLGCAVLLHGQEATMVEKEGRVVVTKSGAKPMPAPVGIGLAARDRLGTGESSRAVLRMSEKWFARIDEETDVEITPGAFGSKDKEALKISLGGAFVYSREEEGELKIQTPSATGGLRGTQLVVRVYPGGRTFMQVLEGEVDLANDAGRVLLQAGEAGEADVGQSPRKTAALDARSLVQWTLYYPAVLNADDLGLDDGERRSLAASLDAYRQGDLLGALSLHSAGPSPSTDATRLYRAAVLLASGGVNGARQAIGGVAAQHPGRRAVERMLAAVGHSELPDAGAITTAGEAVAESYYQQSRRNLAAARTAAQRATTLSPNFGFAWTRLAELEFSFGRIREASVTLATGLQLAPRHAQGHALRGFLLSADNRLAEAQTAFEAAVALDGGLGNAWLGLGLTKIKQGRSAEGRADLQVAATVESTRSIFYSYHGKALSAAGRSGLARKDLALARQLDPSDPTPWLYSAIHAQQENRYNTAIHDLRESQRLNDHRHVYRSRFLLDQDRAVRSSNLARVYQNNGMADLAVREASRGIESDYTNASAHLFLADSFHALRDPKRTSLRHETAWFNEQLLAYLLAPVGGGPLSQFVSQQEYSKLLDADGLGGSLVTEWHDDGYLDQRASLFGTFGKVSAGLDFAYGRDRGTRPNNRSSRREVYGQFKYQASPDDVLYGLTKWQRQDSGDLAQNYANQPGNLGLRAAENQEPGLLLLGWNHRWAPGVHTLVLGGRLAGTQTLSAPGTTQLLFQRDPRVLQPDLLRAGANGALDYASADLRNAPVAPVATTPGGALSVSDAFQRAIAPFLGQGPVTATFTERFDFATTRDLEIYTGEVQHIWQRTRHTLLLGGRWQGGPIETTTRLDLLNPVNTAFFTSPAARQDVSVNFSRQSVYAYDFFHATPALTLIAGASWDRVEHPENFRNPPVSSRAVTTAKTNGKVGFTFSPSAAFAFRGVYTEGTGGVSFDESVRLEPVQLAGFNQAYRTVISESLVGSVEAPRYRNAGLSVEGALPTRTWWSAALNVLREDVARTVGVFDVLTAPVFPQGVVILPAGTGQRLDYREEVFSAGLNQLVGDQFSLGAGYRRTEARLRNRSTQIPVTLTPNADRRDEGILHELTLSSNWNSPSGAFARADANWYSQSLDASAGGQPTTTPRGDDFWQFHARVGYRFHRNLREISIGMLNLTDRDYRLSPLTYTRELPRARTVVVSLRLSF